MSELPVSSVQLDLTTQGLLGPSGCCRHTSEAPGIWPLPASPALALGLLLSDSRSTPCRDAHPASQVLLILSMAPSLSRASPRVPSTVPPPSAYTPPHSGIHTLAPSTPQLLSSFVLTSPGATGSTCCPPHRGLSHLHGFDPCYSLGLSTFPSHLCCTNSYSSFKTQLKMSPLL